MTAFTFTVTRTGDLSTTSTVDWAVTGTGANPASADDFAGGVLPSGTLNFAISDVTALITVDVAPDTVFEADETFTVTISNAAPSSVFTIATALGTIQNDDASPATAPSAGGGHRLGDDYWLARERYLARALRPARSEPARPPPAAPVRIAPPPQLAALNARLARATAAARAATTRSALRRTAARVAQLAAQVRRLEREQDDESMLQAILPHLLF